MFGIDLKVHVGGEGTFCLPKYGLKFKTFNDTIFMFRANKILHRIF